MRYRVHTVLPGQFNCCLPQRLRQLRPPRLRATKLIQLPLQLPPIGSGMGDVLFRFTDGRPSVTE